MKVERITAQVRYSQDTGHGAWKAVEIGAEATVDARERWSEALAHLYADLGPELKSLWANGNGQKATEASQDTAESTVAASQPAERSNGQQEPLEHFCQQHGVAFKRFTRGNSVWHSHRVGSQWHREEK